jgi:predicted TPR repeat methyltransferase
MRGYAAMFTDGPVADLGCGRGYFLEALRDRGVTVVGVDLADEAVAHSRGLGFEITKAEALEFLAGTRGLRGIFASHLIEHLAPETADEMLARAFDALAPGGTIVIVTPNLRDIDVATEIFWLDLTHVRPFPPALVRSMLDAHGFVSVASGRGAVPYGPRSMPRVLLGRLRYGRDYGVTEVWIRGVKPAAASAG